MSGFICPSWKGSGNLTLDARLGPVQFRPSMHMPFFFFFSPGAKCWYLTDHRDAVLVFATRGSQTAHSVNIHSIAMLIHSTHLDNNNKLTVFFRICCEHCIFVHFISLLLFFPLLLFNLIAFLKFILCRILCFGDFLHAYSHVNKARRIKRNVLI